MLEARQYEEGAGRLTLRMPLRFAGETTDTKAACAMWRRLEEPFADPTEENGTPLHFVKGDNLPAEGYRLEVGPAEIRLAYADAAGARNGLVCLYNGLEREEAGYGLPCGRAEDAPDASFRSVLLDMARKYLEPEEVKATLRQMALAGMNKTIFHLMDSEHYAIASRAFPVLCERAPLQQYTPEQMRELVEYAAAWGIEAIPSIDVPGHAAFLLRCMPELSCQVEDDFEKSHWAVCVGNDRLYEVLEKLYDEVYTIFDSGYLAAFGDELEFLDLKDTYSYWVNWEHCRVCREAAEKHHIEQTKQALYYMYVNRVHDIAKRLGKRLIIANDSLDVSKPLPIPRDILILWWRVPAPGRGPWEGCSMQRFLEEGFDVLNGDYPETYIDLYMRDERLCTWSPVSRPYCPPERRKQVVGGQLFAWEGKAHFAWTLPSGIAMIGQKLWNYADRCYDLAYKRRLTRLVLGPDTPPELDIFTPLGGCLLPQDEDSSRMGHIENVTPYILPQLEDTLAALRALEARGRTPLAGIYIRCLEWMKEQLT